MSGLESTKTNSLRDQRSPPKKRKLKIKSSNSISKSSLLYQQCAWVTLHKCIHDLIHNVNATNLLHIKRHITNLNIVRGRGLFCQSIMQIQANYLENTDIYACLVSIINCDFPNLGELLVSRCIVQFKRAYSQNDKVKCTALVIFIGHLINRCVVDSNLAIELFKLFLKSRNEETIELAYELINICAYKLYKEKREEMTSLLNLTRSIFCNETLNIRENYKLITILNAMSFMGDKPQCYLDDYMPKNKIQFTHELTLRYTNDGFYFLDEFDFDTDYIANEKIYKLYAMDLLELENNVSDVISDADDERDNEEETGTVKWYISLPELSIKQSLNALLDCTFTYKAVDDALRKIKMYPGEEINMWSIFIDRCCDQRVYKEQYGRMAQMFCELNRVLVKPLETVFAMSYANVHTFKDDKLQNVAKFFAFLLYVDSISWNVLSTIHLNETETTPISRRFIQILFEELNNHMGYDGLTTRVQESFTKKAFEGIFPENNQKDYQFSKDFFTELGLDGLIDEFKNTLII